MSYLIDIAIEIFKFLKEKGHVEELLAWAEEQVEKTESPIDDGFVKVLRFILGA